MFLIYTDFPHLETSAGNKSKRRNTGGRRLLQLHQEHAAGESIATTTVASSNAAKQKRSYAQVTQNYTAKDATIVNYINYIQAPENRTPSITRQDSELDTFLNAVKHFKTGHLVLITDRVVPSVTIQNIGLVPWSVIFDFDPHSRSAGLLSQAEVPVMQKRSLHIKTWQDKCSLTDQSTQWIFMKGLNEQPDTKTSEEFPKWKKQTRCGLTHIKEQIGKFGEPYTEYYIVVLWPSSEDLSLYVKYLMDQLEELGICEFTIVIDEQERQSEISETNLKQMEYEYEKKPKVVRLSTTDVCVAIGRVFLQTGAHTPSKYDLPTLDSNHLAIDDHQAQWLKEDLEVLYETSPYNSDITLEKIKEESDNFFRGGTWPWYMWYGGAGQVDVEREVMKEIITCLKKGHIELFKSGRVTICHAPGSGGTTLAQRILWELHTVTPCVQVKLRTGSGDIANRLRFLYDKTRRPILILIDGEDEQRVDLLVRDLREMCYVILYVKRYPYPMEGKRNTKNCFWLKRFVSKPEAAKIAYKFLQQCDTPAKKQSVENLQHEVETGHVDHEIFEFGLATYKHHYKGIESYVKGFLQFENESEEALFPWQHALGILSLVYYYGQMPMPCKFFSKLLGCRTLLTIDNFPREMEALIARDTNDGRTNVVRISHYLVAKEILEQILSKPHPRGERGETLCLTAKRKLEPFALDFIRLAAENVLGKTTGILEKIMTRTFISRDNKAAGETDIVDRRRKPKFAQILHDVSSRSPYTERFHILEALVKAFPHEPQFLAHLGRLFSLCRPEDEDSAEQCFRKALEICENEIKGVAIDDIHHSMRLTLMHIYHMYGTMFLTRVSKYTGKCLGDQPRVTVSEGTFDEKLGELFPMVHNACYYFTKCRDVTPPGLEESHGFLGEISIRLMFCDFVFRQNTKGDIYKFIKKYENSEVADFVEDSISVIDELVLECLSVVDPDKIEEQLQVCQQWFASLFKIRNLGGVVFRTDDTVKLRRLEIAARKLLYEKKKVYGVLEEVTKSSDIEFIVKNYEANFEDIHDKGISSSRTAIDLDYREWIFAIRHIKLGFEYTLEDVLRRVRRWYDKVQTPNSRFYLFILCSLLGFGSTDIGGNTELLIEAQRHKEDLLKQSKYVNKPRYPREWLGEGRGIRRLTPGTRFFGHIEGREIKGNFNSESIKAMVGTICNPNDKPASGYIRLDLGKDNLIGVNVFYVPVRSEMNSPSFADSRVEFYLGFSIAHGYEAYNVRLLKRVKCTNTMCGLYLEVRNNCRTKCICGEVVKSE